MYVDGSVDVVVALLHSVGTVGWLWTFTNHI